MHRQRIYIQTAASIRFFFQTGRSVVVHQVCLSTMIMRTRLSDWTDQLVEQVNLHVHVPMTVKISPTCNYSICDFLNVVPTNIHVGEASPGISDFVRRYY